MKITRSQKERLQEQYARQIAELYDRIAEYKYESKLEKQYHSQTIQEWKFEISIAEYALKRLEKVQVIEK